MHNVKNYTRKATMMIAALAIVGCITPGVAAMDKEAVSECTGIVSSDPTRMYDFKLGNWDIAWRSTTGNGVFEFSAVSNVYLSMDGDVMIDEQRSNIFKGMTFRTFDPNSQKWTVRWLPAISAPFDNPISGALEDCVPVERHHQSASELFPGDDRIVEVVTRFTDITEDGFKFRQDWSFDEGVTWLEDVLFYEATRIQPAQDSQ